MDLLNIFTDEVIAEFKAEIKKLQSKKAKTGIFTKPVINAFIDIIKCIEKQSIKTIEDLDDYVEEYYSKNDAEYFVIVMIVQFADGEFDTVKEMFEKGKKQMNFDDIDDSIDTDGDGFVFNLDEEVDEDDF